MVVQKHTVRLEDHPRLIDQLIIDRSIFHPGEIEFRRRPCLRIMLKSFISLLIFSMLLWFSVALASLLVILVALYVCWKWPLYHCLTYPFRECLKHLADMFRALYRWFKVIAFYASLFVTTVVFTFGCCCCFIVIHEWPWVRAHTIVSERFGIDTPIWYLKCVNSKTSPENNPSEEYSDDADSDENNPPEDDSL